MKSHRPSYLTGFDLRPADLAATGWMRAAIARIVALFSDNQDENAATIKMRTRE